MTNLRRTGTQHLRTGIVAALFLLLPYQSAFADPVLSCVDPDFGNDQTDEGGSPGGGTDFGHDDALFQFDFTQIWFGTPWDPEYFGFPDWMWGGGSGGADDPGDDDPGGSDNPGGNDPGEEGGDGEPSPGGWGGASYEGWMTGEPGCEQLAEMIFFHAPLTTYVDGQSLVVVLSSQPKATLVGIRLPRPAPVPDHAKQKLGLLGKWSLAAGTYKVSNRRVRIPLTRGP